MRCDLLAQSVEVAGLPVHGNEFVTRLEDPGGGAVGMTADTSLVPSLPVEKSAKKMTNAITMFTKGPAAITKIRFQTGEA